MTTSGGVPRDAPTGETQAQADDAQCESVWDWISVPEPRYTHFKMGDCELWLPEAMTRQDYDDVLALLKIFQCRTERIGQVSGDAGGGEQK